MPAMFEVRPNSGEPIYLQLMRQIKHATASGALAPGTQLPSVRQLAAELVINPNTVVRAYRELEHAGLLEGVAGRGWFVSYGAPRLRDEERRRRLNEFIDQLWAEGRALGYGTEELADVVAETLRERADAERAG
ncbi:MAG TPA: GntR family transcriptional regulator [Longimicrobium sp.]|nr:GntR family transcriptional regulator [Longimicrobium sp.]